MDAISWVAAALGGYLLGSIPVGLVLVKASGLGDIRSLGSGNIGATNVLRTGRKDLALATLVLDSGKAAAALALARALFGEDAGWAAGACAFLGHCFPVWLKFKGGKGVATFFGTILVGAWPVGVIAGLLWLMTAYTFRFSSLGALVAAAAAPILGVVFHVGTAGVAALVFMAGLIFWLHRANIARLRRGEEPRIGQKKEPGAEAGA